MDFLKKNWGFLFIVIGIVVGSAVLLMMLVGAVDTLKERMAEVTKAQDYLSNVKKKRMQLTEENKEVAEANVQKSENELEELRSTLAKRFELKYTVPPTAVDALRILREEIAELRSNLQNKDIDCDAKVASFTFDAVASSTVLPSADDLGPIFHNLAIIKKVVQHVIDADVYSLDDLKRPYGLLPKEDSFYVFTPIELTITATPENAQKLTNLMTQDPSCFFVLRDISIKAEDEFNPALRGGGDSRRDDPGMGPGGGTSRRLESLSDNGMGRRGEGAAVKSRREAREARRRELAELARNPAAAASEVQTQEKKEEDFLVEVPPKRQDFLLFEPKLTTWSLRFDFIEFAKTEKMKQAEEQAKAATDKSAQE
ncbi:MAG: Amuc_1100 family pilus-like protein [Victivallales bacterium]|nr:Amuc_1100 family pilus-like protein [Victivallales bacterium]